MTRDPVLPAAFNFILAVSGDFAGMCAMLLLAAPNLWLWWRSLVHVLS